MRFLLGARRARQPPSKFCPSIARHKLLSKRQCEVRRKYGRQRSNQLRGARGASAHVCSTGLSTGRRLMPMTARCGAAAPCRGAATVRQLLTRGEWWEAAGCVELTERVQLHLHAKIVAIQTEARPAVQSTQPADALHAFCAIHTVSSFDGAALDASVMARYVCRDLVFEASSHAAC